MESDFSGEPSSDSPDPLHALTADRDRLAASIQVPWTLRAAFGACGAWWVSSAATTRPGVSYEAPTSSWLALLGVLVVAHLTRRETGVGFRTMGKRAAWAIAGIMAGCLTLFSVSLGLTSLGARWAVSLTSMTAFCLTTWLVGVAYRSAIESIRRD